MNRTKRSLEGEVDLLKLLLYIAAGGMKEGDERIARLEGMMEEALRQLRELSMRVDRYRGIGMTDKAASDVVSYPEPPSVKYQPGAADYCLVEGRIVPRYPLGREGER
jgi:hypothetical protein